MDAAIPSLLANLPKITEEKEAMLRRQCHSWRMLSKVIMRSQEDDLLYMLTFEMAGQRRPMIMTRLLGRYRMMRAKREDQEIFNAEEVARAIALYRNKVHASRRSGARARRRGKAQA